MSDKKEKRKYISDNSSIYDEAIKTLRKNKKKKERAELRKKLKVIIIRS